MTSRPDEFVSDERVRELAALDEELRAGIVPAGDEHTRDVLLRLQRHWPTKVTEPRAVNGPFIGDYEILREIGRGGFGVVFLARDASSQEVALKVPRPELFLSEDIRRRFLTEASAIAALSHENIIRVHDVGYAGPVCYIASALCEGLSLAETLADGGRRFTARQAAWLVAQLAKAAHYVHESGLLHRDLKPSNILLWPQAATPESEGLPFSPKLTDFGLAKFVEQSLEDTRSSVLLGTPLYMAPEQAECRQDDIGPWTDVYALGAILYELLAGAPPFAGQGLLVVLNRVRSEAPRPLSSIDGNLPGALSRICAVCLEKEPQDRYASAAELAADLERFLAGEAIRARPPSRLRRWKKFLRQPERMRDAGVWTMLLNIGMLIWMWGNVLVFRARPEWIGSARAEHLWLTLVMSLLLSAPQLIAGWYTIKRQRRAVVLGLMLALLQLGMAIAPLLGGRGPFSRMYPNDMALWNTFWFLANLFSVQVALHIMALFSRPKPS